MPTASYRTFSGTGADNYQRYFVPSIATPVSTSLLDTARLEPGERVLDVACGTGLITRLAAERVGPTGSVTGVDVAPDMIEVAKSVPAPPRSSIEWHIGDAAALPVPSESYDVVLCQMGLMFMEDRAAAVKEMYRALAPGGRLIVNTPGSIQPAFKVMEAAIVDHINADLGGFVRAVFSMDDPSAVAALLQEAGFQAVTTSTPTADLELAPPAEFLWQYINLTPMGPFVADAPERARLAMEQQVVERWPEAVVNDRTLVNQPMVIATGTR